MPVEMVHGIDGEKQEALFVLLRNPTATSTGSPYHLARIDPEAGKDTARVSVAPVASDAPHLSLVAGGANDPMVLVEKNRARALGDHRVSGYRLIPSVQLSSLSPGKSICR